MLTALITAATLTIAAIGFAGSYAAVRELAIKKGFGNFSYVFPIGIDAGICVLLALDLLLTWIRIPFPLLRQTAWLLTAATIAFNGAAAWPDPLGTGMHAVIPILFVVAIEAARHAIGRITDITADKHMEGVRLTRWLLSPLPTFLLWRRMKLWELRSYSRVIKLEQERLVYQARLHSRFGRTWRRKAPVESLMPLRLARYGVPLSETAPAGLAAAGIEPILLPPAPLPDKAAYDQGLEPPTDNNPDTYTDAGHTTPRHTNRRSAPLQDNDNTAPTPDNATAPNHPPDRSRRRTPRNPPTAAVTPSSTRRQMRTAQSAPARPQPHPHAGPSAPRPEWPSRPAPAPPTLTQVDRYYLAWHQHLQQHGTEPTPDQLSRHLADQGIHDFQGHPVKPKTLARYLLRFRIYTAWAQLRDLTDHTPPLEHVLKHLTQQGITAQYRKPLTPTDLTPHLATFERRHHTLNHPTRNP
ncbi:DUF2637 domain-containing protein [Streptomyces adustus]